MKNVCTTFYFLFHHLWADFKAQLKTSHSGWHFIHSHWLHCCLLILHLSFSNFASYSCFISAPLLCWSYTLLVLLFTLCTVWLSQGAVQMKLDPLMLTKQLTTPHIHTLCLVICWVIFAVWVPMGSAELRRLSVALSHSPSGSRPSWNWRAKTCSSSNFLCLKGHKRKKKNNNKSNRDMKRGQRKNRESLYWSLLVFYYFSLV